MSSTAQTLSSQPGLTRVISVYVHDESGQPATDITIRFVVGGVLCGEVYRSTDPRPLRRLMEEGELVQTPNESPATLTTTDLDEPVRVEVFAYGEWIRMNLHEDHDRLDVTIPKWIATDHSGMHYTIAVCPDDTSGSPSASCANSRASWTLSG